MTIKIYKQKIINREVKIGNLKELERIKEELELLERY